MWIYMFYFCQINFKWYRLSEDQVQTWPKAKTDYKSKFASKSNETTPPSSLLTQTFWNSNCKPLSISIWLLITILPLFNLTNCLSSFTSVSFTSSLLANDTEGHRRNMNRLNGVGLVKRIHSFPNIGIVQTLRRFFDWWRSKPEAQLSAGVMNSKELTEANWEIRDWKTSSNSNWERSELRVVCLSLWHQKTRNLQTWKCRLEKCKRGLGLVWSWVEAARVIVVIAVSVLLLVWQSFLKLSKT